MTRRRARQTIARSPWFWSGEAMSGWDKDPTGDYTPRPPPVWFWLVAGAAILLIVGLSLMR